MTETLTDPTVTGRVDPELVSFVFTEARLADEARYSDWEALWDDDALYWVPMHPDADPELTVSYVYDNRTRIRSRVAQLNTGVRHSQTPPSVMRRTVSNFEVVAADGDDRHGRVELRPGRVPLRDDRLGRPVRAQDPPHRRRPAAGGQDRAPGQRGRPHSHHGLPDLRGHMLIGDISRHNARRYPAKTAVIYGDSQLSWAAVDERANRLATYLLQAGLAPGDRVAVCARNTAEWPEITYGLAKAGLVLVPVNIRLTPSETEFIVTDSGCRAAILHTDQAELGAGMGSGPLAGLGTIVEIGGTSVGKDYEAALASGRDADPTPSSLTPDDLHVLLYTSGTTGHPKGVMNDHRGMMAQTLDTTISTEARHADVMLATTPFFTTGGVVRALTWLYLGQTMVIQPRFDPERLLDAIERYRVTMTTFIPTMLIRTLRLLEDGPGPRPVQPAADQLRRRTRVQGTHPRGPRPAWLRHAAAVRADRGRRPGHHLDPAGPPRPGGRQGRDPELVRARDPHGRDPDRRRRRRGTAPR